MKPGIEYKGVVSNVPNQIMVKDIDEAEGRVIGYFATFGNIDSDGDMIMPGAFEKTIKEQAKRIKHLYQHDPWKPLSTPIVSEDKYGLLFDSTISKTSWGRDTIRLYLDEVVDEQSVGFNTIRENKKEKYRELNELKLWEGSTVTWGANMMARTTAVKSMTKDILFKKMDSVIKSIRNGKYENEEIFDQLELYFKQLQQLLIDLTKEDAPIQITHQEPVVTTTQPEVKKLRNWSQAIQFIN